ncbi:unnamed protein product [Amoebophrya sp. A120]|nr:unnamed protein product [Amoebophrya sp. A120]|eukprot:GSA120T00010963001.1
MSAAVVGLSESRRVSRFESEGDKSPCTKMATLFVFPFLVGPLLGCPRPSARLCIAGRLAVAKVWRPHPVVGLHLLLSPGFSSGSLGSPGRRRCVVRGKVELEARHGVGHSTSPPPFAKGLRLGG